MSGRLATLTIALGMVLGVVAQTAAGDYWHKLLGGTCWPQGVGKYCCDDYCRKYLPCPQPITCFTCDDYYRKCLPWSRPVNCFVCDDYCPKPFRLHCPPSRELRCPPREILEQKNRDPTKRNGERQAGFIFPPDG